MKKVTFGAALLLLSSAAYAQVSVQPNGATATGSSNSTIQSSSEPSRVQSGSQGQTRGGMREESGTRVGVGIETRERTGVSVRSRTSVREVEEPSVSVTRRRSVTTYEEPDTEVRRTVVKKKPAAQKVVLKKKRPTSKVVMKKRRYQVVDEPVEVRRRTVRRYEEVNEPSVSVTRRTSVRQTRDVSPSVGVSVEQRRNTIRSDSSVSTTRSNGPETTGTVSTRSQNSGIRTNSSGDSTNIRLQQGGSSGGSATGTGQ